MRSPLRAARRGLLGVPLVLCACGGGGGGSSPAPASQGPGNGGAGSAAQYSPSWAGVAPARTLTFSEDPGLTPEQDGAALAAAILALQPGDRLEIGAGTYVVQSYFNVNLAGTASAPIWIEAEPGASVVITRNDANQNTINLGASGLAEYVCLRGVEITGGDIALRLYHCNNVWIDRCHIHHCAQNAVAANAVDVEYLYFTENEVHDTAGFGEGFYLGGNNGNPVARYCVIAMNHVYDTGGSQGDGIEVKQGSYGNWIVANVVHDTNYPCILVYGTGGQEVNVIERNVCWNSGDNVMQVQGEAIVRNNLLLSGVHGFHSQDHQGSVTDLVFVHNTVINTGTAVHLSNWDGKSGMVLANNALYSLTGNALTFSGGSAGVTLAGNVTFGGVSGTALGFVPGAGLGDFVDVTWDASHQDATPAPGSMLLGAGAAAHAVLEDLWGTARTGSLESGAVDSP